MNHHPAIGSKKSGLRALAYDSVPTGSGKRCKHQAALLHSTTHPCSSWRQQVQASRERGAHARPRGARMRAPQRGCCCHAGVPMAFKPSWR